MTLDPASADPGATLTWVNHASFLLSHGTTGLLSDPWLSGTAFDDGWSHYATTVAGPDLFASTTHIWFSHEHPDHFSPGSLRSIPESDRQRITVLYQPTPRGEVLGFCRKLGFNTVELPTDRWYPLGPDFEVRLVTWSSGDSILAARAGRQVALNVNDAVISDRASMRLLLDRIGEPHVDVLFTQFSYANWEGNPDEVERRRGAARRKLEAMQVQVAACRPRFVVPFASFVWFCHEENDYLNDSVNRVSDAVRAAREQGDATPVVLYPGDVWHIGDEVDVDAVSRRYDRDLDIAVDSGERRTSSSVPIEDLTAHARSFLERLSEINGHRVLTLLQRTGVLSATDIWLTDHSAAVRFDGTGLTANHRVGERECDVALGSEALSFCFRNLYGGATLNVNGRFRRPVAGHHARFRRWMQLANLNNQGVSVVAALPDLVRKVGRVGRDRLLRLRHR